MLFYGKTESGYKEIGVYVKQARGRMVRYLIENKISSFSEVKNFNELGYKYQEELSTETMYIFVREKMKIHLT